MKKKRIQRFYIETIEKNQTHYEITGDQCHYITRVLRLETEDRMILFDGSGSEWMAKIIDRKKNRLLVELMEETTPARESPIKTTLIQSISRGQRMDAVMQKSTELGITRIVPVFSKNTVVKMNEDKIKKRLIHWKNILISASEQSGRTHIPNLMDQNALSLNAESRKKFGHYLGGVFVYEGESYWGIDRLPLGRWCRHQ